MRLYDRQDHNIQRMISYTVWMITWVSDDGFLSSYIIVSYLAILQLHGKTFLRYFHDDGQYHKIVVDFNRNKTA